MSLLRARATWERRRSDPADTRLSGPDVHEGAQAAFEMAAEGLVKIAEFETRRACPSDAEDMALAHRDSIRSIGHAFYPPHVVDHWEDGLTGDVYRRAMERGEVFFLATATVDGNALVLGFASDYCIEGSTHGTSVYVRGIAARRGIGSVLFGLAEAHAVAHGATRLQVDASLAGVAFYTAHGFTEVGRGETRLKSGRPIACVFMRKDLDAVSPNRTGA